MREVCSVASRHARAGIVVAVASTCLSAAGCSSARSFSQLAHDAAAVPTPAGVSFVTEQRSVEDGPGFTTSTSKEVTRRFRTTLPCDVLESSWAAALAAAHRRYHLDNHPHSFGATGSLGITLSDRPEVLGITIGTDDGHCTTPFVYAFNPPH